MSVERALYQRLTIGAPNVSALVGTRIYPMVAPLAVSMPFCTFARISTDRVRSLSGPSGLAMARFTLDALALTYPECRAAADALRRRMDGWRRLEVGAGWSCNVKASSLLSDADLHEPDAEPALFRATLDFMITYEET